MYDRPCLQNMAEKNVSIQVYYPCTKVDPLTKVGKMTVKEIRKILQAGKKKKIKMIVIQNLTLGVMVEHGD